VFKRAFTFRLIASIFLIFISLFLADFIYNHFVFSLGRSTPYHLFWKKQNDAEPKLGDYVVIKTPENDQIAKGRMITKKISCIEGMWLKISGLDYYCCSDKEGTWEKCVYLGRAKLFSKKGERVFPFNPCGNKQLCIVPVPKGEYFLVNNHPDSYDSRYLGFIKKEVILFVVSPIW